MYVNITTSEPDTEEVFLFNRTVNDWSASNDEAIASLLQTVKELKSDLLSPPASWVRKKSIYVLIISKFSIFQVAVHMW